MPSSASGHPQWLSRPRRADRAGIAAFAALLLVAPALAQDPAAALKANRERLEAAENRAKMLQADVAHIDADRARLNVQLQETARLIQRSEGQMTAIEARRDELESQQKLLQGSLAQRHGQISSLLLAMQRMGRNPPPVIITRREDALQMVRSAMLLARAFPELRTQAEELAGRLGDLARVMGDIKKERDKLETETARLKDAQLRLASLMETRRQSLSERREQLDEVRKAAAEISKNVTDLSELITRLDRTVAENTSLGAYEKQTAAAPAAVTVAAPAQSAAPVGPTVAVVISAPQAVPADPTPPAAKTQQPVVVAALPKATNPTIELAPQGGSQSSNQSRLMPATPFYLAKGHLPLPAQGKRVISFGERMPSGGSSKGMVIETRHNAQITAPCDGWVLYASEFRSYGQLLIINGGNGYHVVLAGLSQIDVQLGQFVLAGEPVGTMSAAPKGKAQDNAPVLYVEFRKEGRPVDPEPWWAEGSKKVQG
jgi:septal ring factor EnvC (AmiA/AmiB activator)